MRADLANFDSLPDSLDRGHGHIPGTGFFPGGDGLVLPRVGRMAMPDVLIVGHDFGTLEYFNECIKRGEELLSQPTWRGILSRLDDAEIGRHRCLFTNAFIGYRKTGRNDGAFPARAIDDYVDRCQGLIARQIALLRPRVIVALGRFVPHFLSGLSPDLPWAGALTFKRIDERRPVARAMFGEHRAMVCTLVHPSRGHLNARNRRYISLDGVEHRGIDAEVAMLMDVVA
jgi:hypothetical protein